MHWKQSLTRPSGHLSTCAAESIKDLIRYLRHEDDTRDVRQQLGAGQIIQNDLLPIITQHGHDKTLFDACIRYESSIWILKFNLTNIACHGRIKICSYPFPPNSFSVLNDECFPSHLDSWSTLPSLLWFALVKSLMIQCLDITFWKSRLICRPTRRYQVPLISLLKIFSLFLSCRETALWHFNIITFAVTQRHCVVFFPPGFCQRESIWRLEWDIIQPSTTGWWS